MLNTTDVTRVSLNVRIKSIFSPYTKTIVGDRMYGTYYKKLSISEATLWNLEVFNDFT